MIYFLLILSAFIIAGYFILRDKTKYPTNVGSSGGGVGVEKPDVEPDNTRPEQNQEVY